MRYRWNPRWQGLDRDDLLHLFCLLPIRIHVRDRRWEDREFPPRLRKLFTCKNFFWVWEGRVKDLEFDDVAYLSRFLTIVAPRDVVDRPDFSKRVRAHLRQREDGDYDWAPDMRKLDIEDVPHVLRFLDFSVSADTFNAGNFPARLKSHFEAVEPVGA